MTTPEALKLDPITIDPPFNNSLAATILEKVPKSSMGSSA